MSRFLTLALDFVRKYDKGATPTLVHSQAFFSALTPAIMSFGYNAVPPKLLRLMMRAPTFKWTVRLFLRDTTPTATIVHCLKTMRFVKDICLRDTGVDPETIVAIIIESTTLEKFMIRAADGCSPPLKARHLLKILQSANAECVQRAAMMNMLVYMLGGEGLDARHIMMFCNDLVELNVLDYLNEKIFTAKNVRNERDFFTLAGDLAAQILSFAPALPSFKVTSARATLVEHLPFLLQYGNQYICGTGLRIMSQVLNFGLEQGQQLRHERVQLPLSATVLIKTLKERSTGIPIGVAVLEEEVASLELVAVAAQSIGDGAVPREQFRVLDRALGLAAALLQSPDGVEKLLEQRVLPALMRLQPALCQLMPALAGHRPKLDDWENCWHQLNNCMRCLGSLRAAFFSLEKHAPPLFSAMVQQGHFAMSQMVAGSAVQRRWRQLSGPLWKDFFDGMLKMSIYTIAEFFVFWGLDLFEPGAQRADDVKQELCTALQLLRDSGGVTFVVAALQHMERDRVDMEERMKRWMMRATRGAAAPSTPNDGDEEEMNPKPLPWWPQPAEAVTCFLSMFHLHDAGAYRQPKASEKNKSASTSNTASSRGVVVVLLTEEEREAVRRVAVAKQLFAQSGQQVVWPELLQMFGRPVADSANKGPCATHIAAATAVAVICALSERERGLKKHKRGVVCGVRSTKKIEE